MKSLLSLAGLMLVVASAHANPAAKPRNVGARLKTAADPARMLAPSKLAAWQNSPSTRVLTTSLRKDPQVTAATLVVESQPAPDISMIKEQTISTMFSSPSDLENNPDKPTHIHTSNTLKKWSGGQKRTYSVARDQFPGETTEIREYTVTMADRPVEFTFRADQAGGRALKVAMLDQMGRATGRFAINVNPDGTLHSVIADMPTNSGLRQALPVLLMQALANASLAPYHGLIQAELDKLQAQP